ncbi:MAG: hypothetical protein KC635_02860 [Myxococcales bacterium]|nr:hypothetical protein [Myxococcales bacterium]MCB9733760.1 hypothetical protein [Deltaproteobacteria bacterium]
MKTWQRTLIAAVSCLALGTFATACGDDDGGTTTTDTNTTDTLQADTTEADTTALSDQCNNTADLARIGDTTKADPADIASNCGRGPCISKALGGDYAGFETCTADCMTNGTDTIDAAELSSGCTTCYAASARCTAEKCLQECLSAGSACDTCRNTQGCTPDFYTCSGLPQN